MKSGAKSRREGGTPEETKKRVRALIAQGVTLAAIRERFGISATTVRKIKLEASSSP